jgi:hypothetical protein
MLNTPACRRQAKGKGKAHYAGRKGVWGVKLLLLSVSDLTLDDVSRQLHVKAALPLRNAPLVPVK